MTVHEDKKEYLYQSFGNSSIWNDMQMWKECFTLVMNEKLKRAGILKEKNDKGVWKVFSGIQNMINNKTPEDQERAKTIIKHESLDVTKYYLSNLNLSLGYSTEILTIISKE